MSDSNRNRGILTPGDIQYLRNPSSKSGSSERVQRNRIRNRVRSAIIDFSILFEHLPPDDIAKIMLDPDGGRSPIMRSFPYEGEGPPELEWELIDMDDDIPVLMTGGIRSMHAFSYLSMFEALDRLSFFDEYDVEREELVEAVVEQSLHDVYGKFGLVGDIEVDISFRRREVNLSEIKQRFDSGGEVRTAEVRDLVHTRQIDFDEMVDYAQDESRHKE